MKKNSVLCDHRHGFRKKKSTVPDLVQMIEFIMDTFDDSKEVASTCMDLNKAFDCINHEELLTKLEYIRIRGMVLNLFRSYLLGRHQVVEVNGRRSTERQIKLDVPQRSVLEPILFLTYFDDLAYSVVVDDHPSLFITQLFSIKQNLGLYFCRSRQHL